MKDLIERQAAIDAVCLEGCGMCAECIKDIPAVQQERKVGKWMNRKNEPKHQRYVSCSCCTGIFDYEWKYCPNCGAKMEGSDG